MPHISLDIIHYNEAPLAEYSAVVSQRDRQFIALKLSGRYNESNIHHHKYILTHLESISIVNRIKEKFTELADIQVENELDNYFNFDLSRIGFAKYTNLGPLISVQGFLETNVPDYNLGIVVSNNYHLTGQLEIALVYTHPLIKKSFTVFDKWSIADNKKLFSDVTHNIGFQYNNFENRDILLDRIADSVYTQYRKVLEKLFRFMMQARSMTIHQDAIMPVLLDLKNITRTRSSLLKFPDRHDKLRREKNLIEDSIKTLRPHRQQIPFTYLDFLLLISDKQYSNNDFKKLQKDLTASTIYKDLLTTVESFRNEMERAEYEHEQIHTINIIRDLI
jgi:hypothetical protein